MVWSSWLIQLLVTAADWQPVGWDYTATVNKRHPHVGQLATQTWQKVNLH